MLSVTGLERKVARTLGWAGCRTAIAAPEGATFEDLGLPGLTRRAVVGEVLMRQPSAGLVLGPSRRDEAGFER